MVDDAVASILQSKLEELSASVRIMRDANIHQERNRIHAPSAYDEMFHAVGIAAYIQGIYTNTESLLKQALEITDGENSEGRFVAPRSDPLGRQKNRRRPRSLFRCGGHERHAAGARVSPCRTIELRRSAAAPTGF